MINYKMYWNKECIATGQCKYIPRVSEVVKIDFAINQINKPEQYMVKQVIYPFTIGIKSDPAVLIQDQFVEIHLA